MLRFISLIGLLITLTTFAETTKSVISLVSTVKKPSLGSTYDWQIVINPWSDELIDKKSLTGDTFAPIIYVTDVYSVKRSPHNQEAVVINVKGILAKDYRQPSLGYLKYKNLKIPLRFDLPSEVETIGIEGDIAIFSKENPFKTPCWPWLLFIVILIVTSIYIIKKMKEKSVQKKMNFLYLVREYSDSGKVERFYKDRKNYLERPGAKELSNKIENLQYRPDWVTRDKSELLNELIKIFEADK